jgi:hypothetical protein
MHRAAELYRERAAKFGYMARVARPEVQDTLLNLEHTYNTLADAMDRSACWPRQTDPWRARDPAH